MIPLPETLRIGHCTYKVIEFDHREAAGRNRRGEHRGMQTVIAVDTSYGSIHTAECLLHEVLHAVFTTYSIREGDSEERIVETMGNALTSVWRDNPGLLDWLALHTRGA